MAFVLSPFVLLVPGHFQLSAWIVGLGRASWRASPPFTVARDLADAVAALKAREPAKRLRPPASGPCRLDATERGGRWARGRRGADVTADHARDAWVTVGRALETSRRALEDCSW